MSVSAAGILAVLLAHPAYADRHVPRDERASALQPVAEAIAAAARDDVEAAELLALGKHESGFRIAVVQGRCAELGPRACDSQRARGTWQLHISACPHAYLYEAGSVDSIHEEALCAIRQLRFHGWRCREHALTPMLGAFSGFATGSACHWSGAGARVLTVRRMATELRIAERRGAQ